MKKQLLHIFLLLLSVAGFTACNSDDDAYSLTRPEDVMQLKSTPDTAITLTADKAQETAVTFTWNAASNLSGDVVYYLQMGIDGSDTYTTDTIRLAPDVRSYALTTAQLNRMLTGWNGVAGTPTSFQVRLIAMQPEAAVYQLPETSTLTLTVTPYDQPRNELFISGTANPAGSSLVNAVKMDAGMDDGYTWTGFLNAGDFKLTPDRYSDTPFYGTKGNAYTLVYDETGNAGAEPLHVSEDGLYTVTADLEDMTVSVSRINIDNIWMVGSAMPYGWNLSDLQPMYKQGEGVFVYEGPLNEGELKFPMQNANKFEVPYIMAPEAGKDIMGTGAIDYVTTANATMHDFKWNVPADGDYRVTIDVNKRTIDCERVDLSAQYAKMLEGDRLAKNDMKLYLVGDATPNGWAIANATSLHYNYAADPNCLTWEGYLNKGEIKFPFIRSDKWEVPFYMAATAGEHPAADGNELTFIDNSKGGQPDRKWNITKAGFYQIKVDAVNRKVYFNEITGK